MARAGGVRGLVYTAFDIATAVMTTASWSRFLVQYYLDDTDQDGLLAATRVAMGWPIFQAIRALPRARAAA